MSRLIDLIGQRFGRLVVLSSAGTDGGVHKWNVQCDCGRAAKVRGGSLRRKMGARSCGCLQRQHAANMCRTNKTTHGMSGTREHGIWKGMLARCSGNDPLYGGRGINVCERWMKFENFIADMGPRPSSRHSVDRFPDGNGNYEPKNCRWATPKEQSENRSSVLRISIGVETLSAAEWARRVGLKPATLRRRLRAGWGPHAAVMEPCGSRRPT